MANKALLARPNAHLGGWREKSTGKYQLDISLVFEDFGEGFIFAVGENQKAAFWLDEKAEIWTGGSDDEEQAQH